MKEDIKLDPFVGVGSVKFGEDRAAVRATLGDYSEYKKNKLSKNTLDDFKYCQVFYSADNKVVAIEMYRNVNLIFKNKNLFNLNLYQLEDLFKDPQMRIDEYCLDFPSFGVSISLIDDEPDSILAYCQDYM